MVPSEQKNSNAAARFASTGNRRDHSLRYFNKIPAAALVPRTFRKEMNEW
jgi:hypothetical protein